MTSSYFETTQDLLKQFDLESNKDFFDPIPLTDRKVAFSIKRNYPPDIRYTPAFTRGGKPDNVVAIWVIYTHPSESDKSVDPNRVPVRVRVANMSLYRTKHFDYDFDDPESPTQDSVEQSSQTPKPISLEYSNEFFFDHSRNMFVEERGETLNGIDLLNRAFTEHCDTVDWMKGLRLRAKLFTQSKMSGLISALVTFLTFVLKQTFGRTLEEDDSVSTYYRGYKRDSLKKLGEDSLNVVGYKAAKPVIILFCVVVIAGSIWRYNSGLNSGYFSYIGSSNLLSVVHGLFLLWFLDVVIPELLFWLINGLIKLRTTVMFARFRGP